MWLVHVKRRDTVSPVKKSVEVVEVYFRSSTSTPFWKTGAVLTKNWKNCAVLKHTGVGGVPSYIKEEKERRHIFPTIITGHLLLPTAFTRG